MHRTLLASLRPTTHNPQSLTVRAHAKVNLYLKVLGKRPDGYHDLNTLFGRISLYDTIKFKSAATGICLKVEDKHGGLEAGPGNLVYKAAALLRGRCGVKSGIRIELIKRIPVAAGLGGGSSDAAATLLALNHVWKLRLSLKTLLLYALELGSDVPFFILNTPFAVGGGRGEKLRPVLARKTLWHVLAFPGVKVLTRDIFMALGPKDRDFSRSAPDAVFLAIEKRDRKALDRLMKNTLECVVLPRYPVLARLKEEFVLAGADAAMVSGSGPTVYALTPSCAAAKRVARRMRQQNPDMRFCVASSA